MHYVFLSLKLVNQMFRTQLRALLRESVHGKLRIMFPMVALLTQFRTAKGILEEEKAKLVAEGAAAADDIEVGITGGGVELKSQLEDRQLY